MAQIPTVTADVEDGAVYTLGAAASGDTAECGDNVLLIVQNGDVASHTVTIAIPGELESGDVYPDKTYTIDAGAKLAIPLKPLFRDLTDRLAHLTWSATTSMTRAVLKV